VYFSGLHQLDDGKSAKPFCGMVKVRTQFLRMGEMPKSLLLMAAAVLPRFPAPLFACAADS
jgi:hypothetical protein